MCADACPYGYRRVLDGLVGRHGGCCVVLWSGVD